MIMRMIRVERHQHALVDLGDLLHLRNDLGRNTRTLNHLDAQRHRVHLYRFAVVRANVDIDTQHLKLGLRPVDRLAGLNGITKMLALIA